MKNIQQAKEKLRKDIRSLKKEYSEDELYNKSEEVLSVVEITGVFQDAKTIFFYNALGDEVQTIDFIRKWGQKKNFYLPVMSGDDLLFRHCATDSGFKQSALGIMEPEGEDFTDYRKVDLIIVPGVAFDRKMNRLGRGRGFYDRFLPAISAPKMGICFDFQLFDQIPSDGNDIKMDYIVSENDLIW